PPAPHAAPPAADLDRLAYGRPMWRPGTAAQAHVPATVPVVKAPAGAFAGEPPYILDTGDQLRVIVFGQDGLTNSYVIDASGAITMPLIKAVTARGLTTQQLA